MSEEDFEALADEYFSRKTEFASSFELAVHLRLESFDRSHRIFQRNRDELLSDLKAWSGHEESDWLGRASDVDAHGEMYDLMVETTRLIHNFVASAVSLQEHARTLCKRYYRKHGQMAEFDTRYRATFYENETVNFVVLLRHQFLHMELHPIGATTHFANQAPAVRHHLWLKTSSLGTAVRDGDYAAAQRFLARHPEKVDLYELVSSHTNEVSDFFRWMNDRLLQIHDDDLRRLRSLEGEVLSLQSRLIGKGVSAL